MLLHNTSIKIFNEFLETSRAKSLPNDCINYIYYLYKNKVSTNKLYKENQCVVCGINNLTHHEYLDGVGYICTTCLF